MGTDQEKMNTVDLGSKKPEALGFVATNKMNRWDWAANQMKDGLKQQKCNAHYGDLTDTNDQTW